MATEAEVKEYEGQEKERKVQEEEQEQQVQVQGQVQQEQMQKEQKEQEQREREREKEKERRGQERAGGTGAGTGVIKIEVTIEELQQYMASKGITMKDFIYIFSFLFDASDVEELVTKMVMKLLGLKRKNTARLLIALLTNNKKLVERGMPVVFERYDLFIRPNVFSISAGLNRRIFYNFIMELKAKGLLEKREGSNEYILLTEKLPKLLFELLYK